MKSEIIQEEKIEQKVTFPCLMKWTKDNLIVLVNERGDDNYHGTVVYDERNEVVGLYSTSWIIEEFTYVTTLTIKLSNQ